MARLNPRERRGRNPGLLILVKPETALQSSSGEALSKEPHDAPERAGVDSRLRFAIYARYSSEMQNEMSIGAQVTRCREAVAERGKFDALIFWKFGHLARNHEHAVMIKMLLGREYGFKLYCAKASRGRGRLAL